MPKDKSGVLYAGDPHLIRWPNVFTPSVPKGAGPDTVPKFSATAVLAGNEPNFQQFREELMAELDRASMDKFGATVAEMRQRGKFNIPVRANSDPEAGKLKHAGFAERPNGIHFSATTRFMPPVQDAQRMGMSKDREGEVYDGIFGQILVTAWAWDHPTGGKGLSFNLNGLWKQFDGTKLGGVQADMGGLQDSSFVPEGASVAPTPDAGSAPAQGGDQGTGSTPPQNGGGGGGFGF